MAVDLLSELKPPDSSDTSLEAALSAQAYEEVRVTLPPRLFSTSLLGDDAAGSEPGAERHHSTALDLSYLSTDVLLGGNIFGDLLSAEGTLFCSCPDNW
jgi:hypothetical protein